MARRSRGAALGWPLIAGQGGAVTAPVVPVVPVLGDLSISPNTATIGQPYSGTISGATAGSDIVLDSLTISGTGSTRTVTGTPQGSPGSWPTTETLAGATGSPKTTLGVLNVSAAATGSTRFDSTTTKFDSTTTTFDKAA